MHSNSFSISGCYSPTLASEVNEAAIHSFTASREQVILSESPEIGRLGNNPALQGT